MSVLVVGLNPCRLFDDRYRAFLKLVAGQIGAAIGYAHAYEEERRRAEALAEVNRAKTTFFSNSRLVLFSSSSASWASASSASSFAW